MKTFIYIIIFFNSYIIFGQNTIKVTYQIQRDTTKIFETDNARNNAILSKQQIKVFEIAKDFSYTLTANSLESIYKIDENMDIDNGNSLYFNLAKLMGGGDSVFYQNKIEKIIIEQYEESGMLICEKDTINRIEWKITNITGKIGRYNVVKAVAGNSTAWFTPQIPLPFGPMGYGGLPGLILKIQLGSRILIANKIIISNKKTDISYPKGKFVNAEEMRKKRREEIFKAQQGHVRN